jgi:hypothetical protein
MSAEPLDRGVDPATLRQYIAEQRCPWCGRVGLRSLANHTVVAHQIYAEELRELAELPSDAPLCSPGLSERHRALAREHDTLEWLHQPEARLAAAKTREAGYSEEQRIRRLEHLNRVRPQAVEASRRSLEAERDDPELAAARRVARSRAGRKLRAGIECEICGAWFCPVVPVGKDYCPRRTCSDACYREMMRRVRHRAWVRQRLASLGFSEPGVA